MYNHANVDENEPQHVRKWTDRVLTLVLAKEAIPMPKTPLICIKIPLNTKYPNYVMLL